MWLKSGLFFVVLDQKRQVLGPVVLKVPRQVLVHVVLCYRDVQVRVQVARVLWEEKKPTEQNMTRDTRKEVVQQNKEGPLEELDYGYTCSGVWMHRRLTSEVFHFEVFRAGLLSQQWGVEHDFSLSFDALVELPHGHVTQPLHVLAHLVVGLQLEAPLCGEEARHTQANGGFGASHIGR